MKWREALVTAGCSGRVRHTQLLLQRLRHLRWRRTRQTEIDLDAVVDEPLQSRQRADHYDPWEQTLPQS